MRLREGGEPPRLALNGHCQQCEFRQRCRRQAEAADDISLLAGVGDKELQRYNRKGLFTLTQLSCTFRSRKRGKRVKRAGFVRSAALQALAIRERKVHVYGTPAIPRKPVQVFLDAEGNEDGGFVYLLGVIVAEGEARRSHSFWADSPAGEVQAFDAFLDLLDGQGDAPWPDCGHCKKPLPLFLQLDLGDLPHELGQQFGTGLLQLFYCTRDECEGYGGWEPFADDLHRVRIVQPTGPGLAASVPQHVGHFPGKRIVGWTRFIDLPKPSEHEELGLTYTYDFKAGTVKVECPELGLLFDNIKDHMLVETIANSKLGDKLAGWPAWIQNVEYPNCPRCGRRMVHVFQVDSEDHIPFMFGDAGCGHITQCPDHKEVVAFGWACH